MSDYLASTIHGNQKPTLYHNPSSYFSMIARLALVEAGIDHEQVFVDIHFRNSQHKPQYAKINPHMTVPTLVLSERVIDQSRQVLDFAFTQSEQCQDSDAKSWVNLHYSFSIEELTFGQFLANHSLARIIFPAKLAASRRRLLKLAAIYPDLADVYKNRAAVFEEREKTFNPEAAMRLSNMRRNEATALLERLECHFAGRKETTILLNYGAADVVWTAFLARIEFIGMNKEILNRPALNRYWQAMKSRPSFAKADIWTKMHISRLVIGIFCNKAS